MSKHGDNACVCLEMVQSETAEQLFQSPLQVFHRNIAAHMLPNFPCGNHVRPKTLHPYSGRNFSPSGWWWGWEGTREGGNRSGEGEGQGQRANERKKCKVRGPVKNSVTIAQWSRECLAARSAMVVVILGVSSNTR